MDYKLVVCDCDNTLIDSKGYLPKDNIKAIRQIMDKGIKFVIASGRNDLLVLDYADEIGGDITLIGCNGATIRNLYKGITYKKELIPKDSLKTILNYFDRHNLDFKAYTIDGSYAKGALTRRFSFSGNNYEVVKDFEIIPVNSGKEIEDFDILKLVILGEKAELTKTQADLKNTKGVNVVFSSPICVDTISEKASKGLALAAFAEIMNIKPSEIIAFGDSENDLSMLQYAGLSVCMENGEAEVKKHCTMTTKTNSEAGVAWALDKIFGLGLY
ncbi:MAG: HAD family hydrolase [Clostridiales bacterium]|nr:HAD family hydrolase [Clostridiales bacterium]